jgi:hypothetical protein
MAVDLAKAVARHVSLTLRLSRLLSASARRLWGVLGDAEWWDAARVAAVAAETAILEDSALRAGRRQAASFARVALFSAGLAPGRLPDVEDVYPRHRVLPVDVMSRVGATYRHARLGMEPGGALGEALERLDVMLWRDLAQAMRRVEVDAYAAVDGVVGWRRIVRSESSEGGVCESCAGATVGVSPVGELMPLHDWCHCLPVPVTADRDPGAELNLADLGSRVDGASSRTVVHGELGPVLDTGSRVWGVWERPTAASQVEAWEREMGLAGQWASALGPGGAVEVESREGLESVWRRLAALRARQIAAAHDKAT